MISKPQEFILQVFIVPSQRKIFLNQSLIHFLLLPFNLAHHLDYFLEVKKIKHLSSQVQDPKSFQNQNL